VEGLDHIGARRHEDLVAPLELRATEVVGSEVSQLQVGAGGASKTRTRSARARRYGEVPGSRRPSSAAGVDMINEGYRRTTSNIRGRAHLYRKGDDGTTGLLYGGRVRKDDAVIEANARWMRPRRPSGSPEQRPRRGRSSMCCWWASNATCGC